MYKPEKPNNPFVHPDGPDCCTPPGPGPGPGPDCGACPPGPPPPPPGANGCWPYLPPVRPVPSVIEGTSLYEAMNRVVAQTNVCINQWNAISKNCCQALGEVVEAARANDVYYDDCEVKYTEGYDQNEGATYVLIEKKAVDKCGHPIRVKLYPAFANTTNSGVKQKIMSASFIEAGNVVMTAVPAGQESWYGPAMYRGMPIPGTEVPAEEAENTYLYGFNRHGALRYFAGDVSAETLCQNGMIDVVGSCIPILNDNQLTKQAEGLTDKASITAIGWNKGTGSVFFIGCSMQDQTGLAGASVAKILQGYGCTTAVITSMGPNAAQGQGLMYMGNMAFVPNSAREPENLAYWVISKKPNFKTAFQKEIAELVQITGQNAWKNYLLGTQILEFSDRIQENADAIEAERNRALAVEEQLQQNIDAEKERAQNAEGQLHDEILAEQNRAETAEAGLNDKIDAEQERAEAAENTLQSNIDKETARAKTAENELQNAIQTETNRAKQAEADLDTKIAQETARATSAEAQNGAAIQTERLRAIGRENEIQAALDAEIKARIAADNDIINAIEQEVLARRAADVELQNTIEAEVNRAKGAETAIQNQLDSITSGTVNLPYLKLSGGTLTGNLVMGPNTTLTLAAGPTAPMEAATKKYVDDAIAGGTSPGEDVSKEYVDEQIETVTNSLNNKVNRAGDTMTGALVNTAGVYSNNIGPDTGDTITLKQQGETATPVRVTNVANPTQAQDAATKDYVDKAIGDIPAPSADYLPLSGGTMTGDIEMGNDSVINFYEPSARILNEEPSNGQEVNINVRPSTLAKTLGLTEELKQQAIRAGLDLDTATVQDVADATGLNPRAVVGQTLIGSVYNDAPDMVVQAENGNVSLKGAKIRVGTMQSGGGTVTNVIQVENSATGGRIALSTSQAIVVSPSSLVLAHGTGTGQMVNIMGSINGTTKEGIGQINVDKIIKSNFSSGSDVDRTLDLVTASDGHVEINRTLNGAEQPGGTGQLNVTEIDAPQTLNVNSGTSIDLHAGTTVNVGTASGTTNGTIKTTNIIGPENLFIESYQGTTISKLSSIGRPETYISLTTDTVNILTDGGVKLRSGPSAQVSGKITLATVASEGGRNINYETDSAYQGPEHIFKTAGSNRLTIGDSDVTAYVPMDMSTHKITGLVDGTEASDAVNYKQLSGVSTTANNALSTANTVNTRIGRLPFGSYYYSATYGNLGTNSTTTISLSPESTAFYTLFMRPYTCSTTFSGFSPDGYNGSFIPCTCLKGIGSTAQMGAFKIGSNAYPTVIRATLTSYGFDFSLSTSGSSSGTIGVVIYIYKL